MSLADIIPDEDPEQPTDEARPTRKSMPGQRKLDAGKGRDMGVVDRMPVKDGAPQSLSDIPQAFRKPAKPPGKETRK